MDESKKLKRLIIWNGGSTCDRGRMAEGFWAFVCIIRMLMRNKSMEFLKSKTRSEGRGNVRWHGLFRLGNVLAKMLS